MRPTLAKKPLHMITSIAILTMVFSNNFVFAHDGITNTISNNQIIEINPDSEIKFEWVGPNSINKLSSDIVDNKNKVEFDGTISKIAASTFEEETDDFTGHQETLVFAGLNGKLYDIQVNAINDGVEQILSITPAQVHLSGYEFENIVYIESIVVTNSITTTVPSNLNYIVLRCKYANVSQIPDKPESWYAGLFGATKPGMNHYFKQLSYNQFNFDGSTIKGWYSTIVSSSKYSDFALQIQGCTDKAISQDSVYFPNYDGIIFMWNRSNSEFGGIGFTSPIPLVLNGVSKNYRVAFTYTEPSNFNKVLKVVAHEVGHTLGWLHSRTNYTADNDYTSKWDLMSGGAFNRYMDPNYWYAPVHTIAFNKIKAGWIPDNKIYIANDNPIQIISLGKLSTLSQDDDIFSVAKINLPNNNFFTAELRTRTESNTNNYDYNIPEYGGVIIHKIKYNPDYGQRIAYVVDSNTDGNSNVNDQSAIWSSGEEYVNINENVRISVETQNSEKASLTIYKPATLYNDVTTTLESNELAIRVADNFLSGQSFKAESTGKIKYIYICGFGLSLPDQGKIFSGAGMYGTNIASTSSVTDTHTICSNYGGTEYTWIKFDFTNQNVILNSDSIYTFGFPQNSVFFFVRQRNDYSTNCNDSTSPYIGGKSYRSAVEEKCHDTLMRTFMDQS